MITAQKILSLLADKHSKDVFVPECKDGPTWYGNHFRLDAWVMPRSWSKLRYIGYEIKISRSDFLKDQKYIEYFNLCNELYFVCPQGIIKEDELTDGIGLLIVSKNGTNLYTKKKAKFREIEPPLGLLNYIIMCRSSIRRNTYSHEFENFEYWQKLLEEKDIHKRVGSAISKKLRKEINDKIDDLHIENEHLKKKMEGYEELKSLLSKMGINDEHSFYSAQRKVEELKCDIKNIINPYEIERTRDALNSVLEKLK